MVLRFFAFNAKYMNMIVIYEYNLHLLPKELFIQRNEEETLFNVCLILDRQIIYEYKHNYFSTAFQRSDVIISCHHLNYIRHYL